MSTTETLAEHFNGTGWSVVPTPSLNASFTGVAGAAENDVWAIGSQASRKTENPLIEHWNGTNWSVVPSPNPAPQINNSLFSVAAVSANDVWAVGLAFGPFTEHWDGTSWSIVSTPSGLNALGGLSAAATGTVVAVGKENNSGVILSN